jgi:O-succinylbenzoate synthase
MRVTSLAAFRYRIPLKMPLNLGPRTVSEREGLLVRVETEQDAVGWGDVAPLPGFSPESLVEAIDVLRAVGPSLVGVTIDKALVRILEATAAASVRFGVELALWDARAEAAQTTLAHVLHASPRTTVSYNGLLTEGNVRKEAMRARDAGYRAVKLKVGRQSIEEDVARVRAAHKALGGTTLRLDANRAWSVENARRFAERIAGVPIAYIEEPLADPTILRSFVAETKLPVALDETMQEGAVLAEHAYAVAAVIKPMLVGGICATQRLVEQAMDVHVQPVLSSTFESGIGLRGLVALAASMDEADVPMGLDTYSRLRTDVARPRLPLNGPVVDVSALMSAHHHIDPQVVDLEHPVIAHRSSS